MSSAKPSGSALEVLFVMARLGLIAFGGPVAHLAHYQRELIDKRRWLTQEEYVELVAFCQFLPGPASSQVGMGFGLKRAGLPGLFAAWLGFSTPSVLTLFACAAGLAAYSGEPLGWLRGLLAGVVVIVLDALLKMGKKLCPDAQRATIAALCAALMLAVPSAATQFAVILIGALCGLFFLAKPAQAAEGLEGGRASKAAPIVGWLILLLGVLLPVVLSHVLEDTAPSLLSVYAAFTQTGALVFGGGHVVLPMLQAEVVAPGWMTDEQFLSGYGITQVMPGPIFTLSSFLGATIGANLDGGWLTLVSFSAAALLGVFMPSFGFMAALYPLWYRMRRALWARQALSGIGAAVVGLLVAALYDPVWTKAVAVEQPRWSVAVMLGCWLLLSVWKRPAWQVVLAAAAAGALLQL